MTIDDATIEACASILGIREESTWSSAVANSSSVYSVNTSCRETASSTDDLWSADRYAFRHIRRLKFRIVALKVNAREFSSGELEVILSRSLIRVCTCVVRTILVNRRKSSQITESFPPTCASNGTCRKLCVPRTKFVNALEITVSAFNAAITYSDQNDLFLAEVLLHFQQSRILQKFDLFAKCMNKSFVSSVTLHGLHLRFNLSDQVSNLFSRRSVLVS